MTHKKPRNPRTANVRRLQYSPINQKALEFGHLSGGCIIVPRSTTSLLFSGMEISNADKDTNTAPVKRSEQSGSGMHQPTQGEQ